MKTNEAMSAVGKAAGDQSASAPVVTVCLPTIGRMSYVRETLRSLARQTLQSYELLVLYNGTDQEIQRQFEELAAEHPGGRVLAEPARLSMFANFNRGLREAGGRYVVFFHDDDIYEPDFLKESVVALESQPSAAFAGSNYYIIDGNGRTVGLRKLIRRTRLQPGFEFIAQLIHRGRGALPTPGIVFRKDAFDELGWDESLSMHFGDFVVFMRMAEKSDVALIERPLIRLRLHEKNASNVAISVAAPLQFGIISRYIDDLEKRSGAPVAFIARLRKSARAAMVRGLTWGWLSAESRDEGRACISGMRDFARGRAMVLAALDRFGLVPALRRPVAGLVRRAGRRVG